MVWDNKDIRYMRMALNAAKQAADMGEIPVGAVIVDEKGNLLSIAHNLCESRNSPLAHAEMLALEEACRTRGDWRLQDCTLYVTLEPCPMCTGALIHARVGSVVYSAPDARAGACGSLIDLPAYPLEAHPKIRAGVLADESLQLLRSFFKEKREKQSND